MITLDELEEIKKVLRPFAKVGGVQHELLRGYSDMLVYSPAGSSTGTYDIVGDDLRRAALVYRKFFGDPHDPS